MPELWWAEAAIPIDRAPDRPAAYAAVAALTMERFAWKWHEYVTQLDDRVNATDVGMPSHHGRGGCHESGCHESLLARVRELVSRELDLVVAALRDGRPRVCAFHAGGLRVHVHCSGFGVAPDALCSAWLNIDSLGLLQVAGFVETRSLDVSA